jgi:chaperone BCS1
VKEYITAQGFDDCLEDMFIVTQTEKILYNKDLRLYVTIEHSIQNNDNEKKEGFIKTNEMKITLFSYITQIPEMRKYVDLVKKNYLKHIEKSRANTRYIYTLCKPSYVDSKYECWQESCYESSKTFANTFFEGKEKIVENVKFFLENREWYFKNGIPYTLGIGLSGKPGTGKTSFFKCLANMTNRHIVIISLKLIKTKQQLDMLFKEDTYNWDNKKHSIGFDKKIIILEDIDCMGEVVLDRAQVTRESSQNVVSTDIILKKLLEQGESTNRTSLMSNTDDLVTLDDILNLWDGLAEMPGRILGISSNHYEKLDPALTRPGRIDITLNMEYASINIIRQMFFHFYGKEIEEEKLAGLKEKKFSPAEIINFYFSNKTDSDAFVDLLHR